MSIIEVERLVKVYGGSVRAVDGISFEVRRGEVFGFLGPNGAGKTTTIRIIVTLLAPTSGQVTVEGLDLRTSPEEIRRRIGYAAQFMGIDDDLTGRENLVLQGRLHGLTAGQARTKSAELIEVVDLGDAAGRRAGTYSGGMRRRLDLAAALVHGPRILFLDEPTTGLDPQNRRGLWSYLRSLRESGVTIFLTTQYMEEADALADRLAIIDRGTIVAEGSPEVLKDALGGDAITLSLPRETDERGREDARRVLEMLPGRGEVRVYDTSITVFLADGASRLADVVRGLDAAGVAVSRLEVAEPSLDDVFLHHTGERMRVEEVTMPRRRFLGRRRYR